MSEERGHYLIDSWGTRTDPQVTFPYSEQSPMDGTAYVRVHPQDMDTLKQYIAKEVQHALHPALGTCDVMHFLTVEATDEMGKRWRGVLYAIEEEET